MTIPKTFALLGTGFWAQYQLAAWRHIRGAKCVALYNRTRLKAELLAERVGGLNVYDDLNSLFDNESLDFVDIVVGPDLHQSFVESAAARALPIICQKPLAPNLNDAHSMLRTCDQRNVPLLVHENWRWQTPIRAVKAILDGKEIGDVFRARIDFITGFAVFDNQPFLAELDQFILSDIGTHILDTARYLFGEATSVYTTTQKIHTHIRGEDVATVILTMESGATVVCNMAYSGNPHEHDRFPETFMSIEGTLGTIELAPDYWVKSTTSQGTHARRWPPPRFAWADPAYDLVHASIVPCCQNLFSALFEGGSAETSAVDNLNSLVLVDASYRSAANRRVIEIRNGRVAE